MPKRDIIVIGGSAGAFDALTQIISALPFNLPASVFVVIHSSPDRESKLPGILQRSGRLPATQATHLQEIERGRIYVAPSDRHLILENRHVMVMHGTKENRSRPAIDPLFRSAARAYGSRVIAVLLSGALDDGTAGIYAVKKSGGIAIVQDPAEAPYHSMPQSAIAHNEINYVLRTEDIAPVLRNLIGQQVDEEGAPDQMKDDMKAELEIASQELDSKEMIDSVDRLGRLSMLTCPESQGALWELRDGELLRYRCHVGHAFSIESLDAEQAEKLEGALWSALRALEERVALSHRLAKQARERKRDLIAKNFESRAEDADKHAEIIRSILLADPEKLLIQSG